MGDNDEDKELKQKLNFSSCEEEHENEGQKETQESTEPQSQTPEKPGAQDSGSFQAAELTPVRTPLSDVRDLNTFQEKGQASPGQGLRTPVSHSLARPETPAPPDKGKPPRCESPFTPKVSPSLGRREPGRWGLCSFGGRRTRAQSYVCVTDLFHRLYLSSVTYFLVNMKKSLKLPENRI